MTGDTNRNFNRLMLAGIILLAAGIRFWAFPSMQFMHDELSAVIRSQGSGFSEVIYKTATTDVHPVFVPVFVHYWTKFFGTGEMIVKLPFVLFGLLSIFYVYKIAAKWFNPTVALLTCACLATLQFPTMYGQLERPYATGMLFSVLMAWCWTQFFFSESRKTKYSIGFVIFASLCTYNHYFSLLFAAMVGFTGLFFLNRSNYKAYLTMCFSVLVLFLPHVNILLIHLSVGNDGEQSWLGKPQSDWLLTFIKYLFHYSYSVYALTGLLFFAGLYFSDRSKKIHDKLRIIALFWGITVPALAYFYSVAKTPVLQFSTFTFGLPFLLIFIFSFYKDLRTAVKVSLVAVVVLINTLSLFYERKHFPVFYKHPYEEMARISDKAIAAFGENRVSCAHFAMKGFVDFYFSKYGRSFSYYWMDKYDLQGFIRYLDNEKTDYFVAGNLPREYVMLVKERYPYLISVNEGFTFSVYCFSKTKPKDEVKERILLSENQSELFAQNKNGHWENAAAMTEDPVYPGVFYMRIDSTQEFSAGFTAPLKELIKSKHSLLNVSAEISVGKEISNPTLVVSVEEAGKPVTWKGAEFRHFKTRDVFFNSLYASELFSGMDLDEHQDAVVKVYVWNRDKKNILVKNFKVEVIASNPIIYGLYEPIE